MADSIRVRAVTRGYYLSMRLPGDVFDIPLRLFTDVSHGGWMEKVEPVAAPAAAAQTVVEQRTLPPAVVPRMSRLSSLIEQARRLVGKEGQ